ncbi:MAG: mechanosensitive ion channel protein MscS [Deltaproteobacteria bacterium]|nr:mechanosensitive ion channel protein MscS [Deltaproteobacteria bacterium]
MDSNELSDGLQTAVDTASGLIIEYGMSVVGAIVLLIVGRVIAGWASGKLAQGLKKAKTDASLIPFFSSMLYYVILGVVLIAVLNLFGVETTSLIAVFGAAGLAVGLALQGTLSNFAAGVMLLIFRPIRVGDFVEVAGQAGTVTEISIFSTIMNTGDNVRIMIPNSQVYGDTVKNYSTNETRRIDLVMGIGYGDDIGRAISIIERVLTGDERTLADPAPTVAELADSSVNLVVRPWCKAGDYWALRWDLLRALKEELEAGGCSIPFPQSDVHVLEFPGK